MSEEIPPEGGHPQAQSTESQAQSTQSPSQVQSKSQPGSSSSSGPTSASQSSSGSGTLSSVDTIPVTLSSVPEEPEPQPWGRLLPMAPGFRSLDCFEDQYLFGRDSQCNYVLNDPNELRSKKFRIYSKKHFRVYREGSEVFVVDFSNNGTFVDGLRIGKDMKLPLVNNAVISLAEQRNKVFVFIDLMSDHQSSLPKELQEKYLLTRRIGTIFDILYLYLHHVSLSLRMEGGELFHRVKSHQLDESVTKLYFYQMLKAVQYLHSKGIIHRDLKPENILLSSQDDVCLIKVTDFNQSRILEETLLMRTLCGTPSYLAPEVFTQASTTGYSLAVDAWSLGVLLFVCLCGYPPFHESFGRSITEQIIDGEFTMVPSKWRHISDQAKDVVRKLLVVDPRRRMTIEEALQHPWLQDGVMVQTAHRLMFPSDDDAAAAVATPEAGSAARRKRERDGDEEHPAKRSQAPPPAPV
ncbi:serine/threonine-protein kinase Chk2 [Anarrhichthys ocellatus]|uniref:serine/threonine-protein kinase Chk2 n=1 Tax=Anarrhichthys ocellatus TaxID=433405 RepID=UPI0012EE79E8|nr:serine/threonine-protein kinase Chk2-like [Anarrhichthys ocellatus]